jgi:hypothetical protein
MKERTVQKHECGKIADPKRESKWIIDPICHREAGHTGCCVITEKSGIAGVHYTTKRATAMAEWQAVWERNEKK